jgi:hypothetical protein
MFFWQDEKDALRDKIAALQQQVNKLEANLSFRVDMLGKRVNSLNHPYGAKKDGTPKAKPGRKPKK